MSDSLDFPVKSWEVSYYLEKTWRWIYGPMSVTPMGITFVSKSGSTGEEMKIRIQFQYFAKVRKTTTGLVFGAVMVETKDGTKHWFSSLPDRDGIYNTIYHFWTYRLLPSEFKPSKTVSAQTKFAKNLLSIVQDSESTLTAAASQLKEQGDQFDVAMATMYDLHSDLDVANNLVSGLEAWLGRWQIPKNYITSEPVMISSDDIPEMYEWEILYTKLVIGKVSSQNLGLLRISKDGITFLTVKQKTVHHFTWIDVSNVRVITPWEIIITKNLIGQPDLSFAITCTNMIAVLKVLEKRIKRKIHYETPRQVDREYSETWHGKTTAPPSQHSTSGHPKDFSISTCSTAQLHSDDVEPNFDHISEEEPMRGLPQDQLTCSTNQKMTDADVEQLSSALDNLKSLALAVRQEEEVQNEKLDSLTVTVERANIRIQETQRRVNRLT